MQRDLTQLLQRREAVLDRGRALALRRPIARPRRPRPRPAPRAAAADATVMSAAASKQLVEESFGLATALLQTLRTVEEDGVVEAAAAGGAQVDAVLDGAAHLPSFHLYLGGLESDEDTAPDWLTSPAVPTELSTTSHTPNAQQLHRPAPAR
mmetsp:Transcript_4944/g.12018  ORF Transcript_4944/g.12018 Transcript_4944/m.12018 type:complete len:152 (+) Transcript_4944:433-888(+)